MIALALALLLGTYSNPGGSIPCHPEPCCWAVVGGWACSPFCPCSWWQTVILIDDFDHCGHRVCSPVLGDPPPYDPPRVCPIPHFDPFCWWSRVVGYDPTLLFRDGFESGDLRRWSKVRP